LRRWGVIGAALAQGGVGREDSQQSLVRCLVCCSLARLSGVRVVLAEAAAEGPVDLFSGRIPGHAQVFVRVALCRHPVTSMGLGPAAVHGRDRPGR
jgi:hypothetical protein